MLFSPDDRHEVEIAGDDYMLLRERDIHAVAAERVESNTGLYLLATRLSPELPLSGRQTMSRRKAAMASGRAGAADRLEPGARIAEVGVGPSGRHGALGAVAARVGAEVADVGADPAQRGDRIADPLVGDVALAVDREAVLADALLGRARLDPGQVDRAGGELGRGSRAARRSGRRQVGDQGRAVVAGRRRGGPADGSAGRTG